MAGHTSKQELLRGTSQVIGASITKEPVSNAFKLSHEDSLWFRADVTAASVTIGAGITATLQDSWDGLTWFDKATVAVTGDGTFGIKLLPEAAGDQTHLPLRPIARIALTTGAGSAATITSVMRSYRG